MNFADFFGEGRRSYMLAQALLESERKVEALKEELESLRRCRGEVFAVPILEWIWIEFLVRTASAHAGDAGARGEVGCHCSHQQLGAGTTGNSSCACS